MAGEEAGANFVSFPVGSRAVEAPYKISQVLTIVAVSIPLN